MYWAVGLIGMCPFTQCTTQQGLEDLLCAGCFLALCVGGGKQV